MKIFDSSFFIQSEASQGFGTHCLIDAQACFNEAVNIMVYTQFGIENGRIRRSKMWTLHC